MGFEPSSLWWLHFQGHLGDLKVSSMAGSEPLGAAGTRVVKVDVVIVNVALLSSPTPPHSIAVTVRP